jgi:hypothetical protein
MYETVMCVWYEGKYTPISYQGWAEKNSSNLKVGYGVSFILVYDISHFSKEGHFSSC